MFRSIQKLKFPKFIISEELKISDFMTCHKQLYQKSLYAHRSLTF